VGSDVVWADEIGVGLAAYSRTGGCGSTCTPVRVAHSSVATTAGPVLANGVLYQGTGSSIEVWDATGASGCSATPVVCQPIANIPVGGDVLQVIVSNGRVLVVTTDSTSSTTPGNVKLEVLGTS
jgi:hypothetical protein